MSSTITTPFGFSSTADEVLAGVDLSGRSALVTGGASGIGLETARALARAGATVTLAVRDVAAGNRAGADIVESTGNDDVRVAQLDLTSVASISAFSRRWNIPLHMLILNAGVMAVPTLERNDQGHELQFATNYLGHFALTMNLYPWLERATGARVVSVSSNAHHFSPVVFEDIDYEQRPYDPWSAYGQSKTADILLAVEITRRWSSAGICANALNPGAIPTNLQRYTGEVLTPIEKRKTPQQGAATSVLLAASPLVAQAGGRYFEDIDFEQRPYDPWSAYGQSKTADILLAVEITRRWSSVGICANALNPGAIATNLQRYTGEVLTPVEKRKTPQQGAATSVLLAASPLVADAGGRYFEDCNEAPVVSEPEMFGGGVNPWAIDPESAQRLWELSIPLIS